MQNASKQRYLVHRYKPFLKVGTSDTVKEVTFDDHGSHGTSNTCAHAKSSIGLPDPMLIKTHAALAGILDLSGAAGLFTVFRLTSDLNDPAVPIGDGTAFMNSVIKYAEPEISLDVELQDAVGAMYLHER